jgi:hydrogenase-4 component F
VLPVSGVLWVMGFLAITGSPPFGPFLSELTILKGALDQGRGALAVAYLALLAVIFVGMASAVLRMAQGLPLGEPQRLPAREPALAIVSPAILALLVLFLGLYVPGFLRHTIVEAARALG